MKKRILLSAVYLLLLSVLPGCWDYIEYEKMAQIIGMGIDYDVPSGNITLTIQFPSIKKSKSNFADASEGESNSPWITHSVTDKTILGAFTKLQEVVPQKLFYGYLKVLIVSETAAQHVILNIIDMFDRTPTMRSSAYVVITAGKAEDVIKISDPSLASSCETIHNLIQAGRYSGTTYAVSLNEFLQMLVVGGWEATAPRVISVSRSSATAQENDITEPQGNIKLHMQRPGGIRVSGMAAFQGATCLGWLDDKETRGLGWITNKDLHTYKMSEPAGESSMEDLYFRILKSKSTLKVHFENDQPVITVNVKVVADLRKYPLAEEPDFILADKINAAEQILSVSLRSDIDAALHKGQRELKSDIFGFGFALFRENPKLWRQKYETNWANIYPSLPVQVNIDAKVVNAGLNTRKLFIK